MADRVQKYADWLVANQNKKGTPEFKTVADAYKQLRGQSASAAAPTKPAKRHKLSSISISVRYRPTTRKHSYNS